MYSCLSGTVQAFPRGSQLAIDFSTAILKLSESGELQRIYDQWLSSSSCSSSSVTVGSNQLGLSTFWGLFLITGSASLFCCIVYLIHMAFVHKKRAGSRIDNQVLLLYTLQFLHACFRCAYSYLDSPSKSDQTRNSVHLWERFLDWETYITNLFVCQVSEINFEIWVNFLGLLFQTEYFWENLKM